MESNNVDVVNKIIVSGYDVKVSENMIVLLSCIASQRPCVHYTVL